MIMALGRELGGGREGGKEGGGKERERRRRKVRKEYTQSRRGRSVYQSTVMIQYVLI